MQTIGMVTVIFLLAFFSETLTEHVFGTWLDGKAAKYAALGVGVLVALGLHVTIFTSVIAVVIPGLNPVNPWVDMVFSGLVIGQGSSYTHQFMSKFFPPSQPNPTQ